MYGSLSVHRFEKPSLNGTSASWYFAIGGTTTGKEYSVSLATFRSDDSNKGATVYSSGSAGPVQIQKALVNGSLLTWYLGNIRNNGKAYRGSLDSVVVHSGKASIRLESIAEPLGETGEALTVIPADSERGKTMKVSVWVRTKDVASFVYLGGNDGSSQMGNMKTVPGGTNDWKRYSFELKINPNATYIELGFGLYGTGTVWFDDIRVQFDGKDYVPDSNAPYGSSAPTPHVSLTDDQLEWLRSNISPLTTTDPAASLSDLAPIKTIVGNAEIVGLGEATHGTHEFFELKHRIVEYLAKNMGFTIFAIEANMPEAYRVNDYVLHGTGDPAELIKGMYFWTWNTEEMLDMVTWMREFNLSGKGRVQFLGFDMQYMTNAAANVQWFLDHHDTSISHGTQTTYALARELILRMKSSYASYYSTSDPTDSDSASWLLAINNCRALEKHLGSYPNTFSKAIDPDTLAWALQNARIVTEAVEENYGYAHRHYIRDSCMAWNVKWIHDHNPGAKIVLWAHDAHIQKDSGSMGYYLDGVYGSRYVNIGFSFYDGTYTAVGSRGLNTYTAKVPPEGTAEYGFHLVGKPLWLLDIRKSSSTDPASNWLRHPISFRTIGAMESNSFSPQTLSDSFDALIFVDHSTASHILPPGQ